MGVPAQDRVEGFMMSKFLFALGLAAIFCGPANAQDVPRYEIFGGYSYLNADTNNLATPSRQSANGWEASFSWNYNKWFALEGDVGGYYKTEAVNTANLGLDLGIVNLKVSDYGYLGGPRFNFRPVFFHALVGGDHLTGSVPSVVSGSASQDSFAAAFGGGVEWRVASHWAVRGSADYALTRHNILNLIPGISGKTYTQDNFRVSAGLVFLLGEVNARLPVERHSTAEHCDSVSEAPILGVSGCATVNGLKVTLVQPYSPGAKAGINPGDTVVKIDGHPVQSGRDIELAIAASRTGTITVGYMIRETWLTEEQVQIR
jgi:opacity protein-like surface antigen